VVDRQVLARALAAHRLSLRVSPGLPVSFDGPDPTLVSTAIRYVDDLLILCESTEEGERLPADLAALVRAAGLELKPTAAVVLTDGVPEWLGFHVKRGPSELELGTAAKSWTQLKEALKDTHQEDMPGAHARTVVKG
jgi:hypothetical protein